MKNKRILIVEDDAELAEEMADLLESEGYSLQCASSGSAGMELVRKRDYDVFLLDYKLADATGLALLHEIRRRNRLAAVYVVSGRPGIAALIEKEAFAKEIDGVIEKPFAPLELIETLALSPKKRI